MLTYTDHVNNPSATLDTAQLDRSECPGFEDHFSRDLPIICFEFRAFHDSKNDCCEGKRQSKAGVT